MRTFWRVWKTVFVFLLMRAFTAIGAFGLLVALLSLAMLFFASERDKQYWQLAAMVSGACFVIGFVVLVLLSKKNNKLLDVIDKKESLNLNKAHVLGTDYGAVFMAFDMAQKKLVIGNFATGEYQVHPFSYVRSWHADYSETVRYEPTVTGGPYVPGGGGFQMPGVSQSVKRDSHRVVVEVRNIDRPMLSFLVSSEKAAHVWVSRLDAIFNA